MKLNLILRVLRGLMFLFVVAAVFVLGGEWRQASLLDYESVEFRSRTVGAHEMTALRAMLRHQSPALLAEKPSPTALAEMIKGLKFLSANRHQQRKGYDAIVDSLITFAEESQMSEADKRWLVTFR